MPLEKLHMRIVEDKKRFIILVTIMLIITIILAITASIVFYPRIENVSTYEELSIASQNLAKANTELSEKVQELRKQKEELAKQTLSIEQQEILDTLRKTIGTKEIEGKGVSILLNDAKESDIANISNNLCHGANLRDIINLLRLPQLDVEGISINGERMHFQSTMNCFADGVAIDTNKMYAPYRIDVIGNSTEIIQHLKTRTLIPEIWKQIDQGTITVDIQEQEVLKLKAVQVSPQSKYIQSSSSYE